MHIQFCKRTNRKKSKNTAKIFCHKRHENYKKTLPWELKDNFLKSSELYIHTHIYILTIYLYILYIYI